METFCILELYVAHLVSNHQDVPEALNWSALQEVPSGPKVVHGVESRTQSEGGASSFPWTCGCRRSAGSAFGATRGRPSKMGTWRGTVGPALRPLYMEDSVQCCRWAQCGARSVRASAAGLKWARGGHVRVTARLGADLVD